VLAMGLMGDRSASEVAAGPQGAVKSVRVSETSDNDAGMGPDVALRVLEGTLIGGEISPKTDAFIHGQLAAQPVNNPTDTLNLLTALLIGSPEFQVR
jgi:hypothetical protein